MQHKSNKNFHAANQVYEIKIHPIFFYVCLDLIVNISCMYVFCMKIAATYVITNSLVMTTRKYIINVIKCS